VPHTYTNGVVTFYEDSGEGPEVVFIHGYGGDLRLWDGQVPPLIDAGFRVIRYDARGHGRSMIAPDGYTYENYSADLRDLLDRLNVERPATESLEVGAVHLVGLSMGGGIALQFALDYPTRATSLTLVDSTLPGFTYGEDAAGRIEALMVAVRTQGAHAALESVYLQHPFFDGIRQVPEQFQFVREIVLGFQAPDMHEGGRPPGYRPDLTGRLGDLAAPTLIILGEHDIPDFHLIASVLAENIPRARLETIRGCWHLPPIEKPDEFNRLLVDFLKTAR
jgi:3-oxoadipate enol-lactonase